LPINTGREPCRPATIAVDEHRGGGKGARSLTTATPMLRGNNRVHRSPRATLPRPERCRSLLRHFQITSNLMILTKNREDAAFSGTLRAHGSRQVIHPRSKTKRTPKGQSQSNLVTQSHGS
jgi:hypothetical protein